VALGPSVSLQDAALNAPILYLASSRSQTRGMGFLASANYKLKDRYLLSVNARMDGSSKFGSNERWGLFPSLSLGWRFSSEEWFSNSPWLSNGKLRIAWGQVGTQPGSPYDRHAIFDAPIPNQYIENPIIVPMQVQLDNLKWETVTSWNLGLDIGLFKERITLTGELYNKVTEDILWPNYEIPNSAGIDNSTGGFNPVTSFLKWYNGGSVQNQGWEFFTRIDVIRKGGLTVNINFNIARNFNSFTEFPDNFNNERNSSIATGQYPVKANIGQPIGSFYGFRYLGVWPSDEDVVAVNADGDVLLDIYGEPVPLSYKDGFYEFAGGDAIYEDVNHDGQIDLNDVVYLGDSNPSTMGGFGTAITWKQFYLSAQFQYRTGFQIVNRVALNAEGMRNKNNQSKAVLHRWTYQGQDFPGMLPRAYMWHPANNLGSDRYVEDGDFLRLNYLTLSYALPREICQRLNINALDIALTMRKLLTITNYSGQDPEVPQISDDPFWIGADNARTPPSKAFTLSVALGF
jgi:TonB-linked SusC/RagA family outer membrane protein